MSIRSLGHVVVGLTAVSCSLLGVPAAAHAASTAPHPHAAVTLYYDDSGAAEFKPQVEAAAKIWNGSVENVQLQPGNSGNADFKIVAYDGWPETETTSLGHGTIEYGREAVNEGYDKTRIAAHEMGHILGLPDNRDGKCSDLMSGHSAPVSCTNATPSAAEAAQVDQNFAGGSAVRAHVRQVYRDCFVSDDRALARC